MNKRFIKILSALLSLLMIFSSIPIATISVSAASVSRDDGTWLFPLSSGYYNSFSDWAGCPGYGKCSICGIKHSSSWGDGDHTGQSFGHNGFDISATGGTNVLAAASGYVYYVNKNWNARGYTVVIEHKIGNGYSYYSYYQHLSKVNCVSNGSYVEAGTVVAKVGNTGGKYGNHLHFGIVMGATGLGASVANMNTNQLNKLEGAGWLLSPGYKNGRILNNPAASNDAGYPKGQSLVLAPLKSHYGSTHYTFNKSKVSIGKQQTPYISNKAATNISNYGATVNGTVSPNNSYASEYGFYFGKNTNCSTKICVGLKKNITNFSANIQQYPNKTGEIKANTTYYYKMYAVIGGKQYVSKNATSFKTTNVQPGTPTLKVNTKDIALNTAISVSWNTTSNTQKYQLKLYDSSNKVVQTATVTGNSHSFDGLTTAGTYYATVTSVNNAGSKTSAKQEIIVHPDVKVTFLDNDGTKLCDPQVIGYNKSAVAPATPSRKGYTFSNWSEDFTNVKEDLVVKARYTINKYTVKFVDSEGEEICPPQLVEYQKSATAPDVETAAGYELKGWDKDFSCVEEDMTVTANVDWYNKNYKVYTVVDEAIRIVDEKNTSNEGYDVNITITNNDEKLTRGRVVVALLNSSGKLLTSTESAAFSIKVGAKKEVNVFVPYDEPATQVKVYTVANYSNSVPISAVASKEVDQSQAYTAWSTELPPEDAADIQKRTEYRYKTKSTTTSYSTSLSGYTQTGSSWVKASSGSVDYVSSWPSGFNKNHSIYKTYNKSAYSAYENATQKRTVSTSIVGYIYYHWCRGDNYGAVNRTISYYYTSEFDTFHAFTRSSALSYYSKQDAFQLANTGVCKSSYWWNSANPNSVPIRRCSYVNYNKLFTYEKWSDFSEWSTTSKTADANTTVETRTVYRYITDEAIAEDNSGVERTISGNIGKENAGKEATLFIYKVDSASDYSNEHIGQTVIDEEGNYSFTFKLREEPTVQTGDFTVELGVEGASTGVFLDKIEAPKKKYTVKFYDYTGKVISTQEIEEGGKATLPAEKGMAREGYDFLYWTESNRNIRENLDIYPIYKLKEYTVVFVDWTTKQVSMEKFNHGEALTLPELGTVDEDKVISWDGVKDGDVVTKDMIITTVIEDKTVNVMILGYKDELLSQQFVKYDTAVDIPEIESNDDYIFLGWKTEGSDGEIVDLEDSIVTANTRIFPEYVFAKTVECPTANIEQGEYNEAQTVKLSCATEDAVILYTTDGTDPATSKTAKEYTEPFVLSESCRLRFIAMCLGMNDSGEVSMLLAINTGTAAYHILDIVANVYYNSYPYSALVKDNYRLNTDDFKDLYKGYTFDSFYYDADFTEEFITTVETVTESLTLYANYIPNKYIVTFKNDDGTTVKTEQVDFLGAATAPEMSKDGYVFIGWDSDAYLSVEGDTTVTAKYVLESEYATVSLNRSKLSILEGLQFTLKATVSPVELADKAVEWTSENADVATVDQNGLVTAIGIGTTNIYVTVIDTGEKATCKVTVSGNPEKAIYLNLNSSLGFDSEGYLRQIKVKENTVAQIKSQFMNENLGFFSVDGKELKNKDLVGTGTVIKLMDESTEIDSVTCVMTGDYTGDGKINNKDSVALSRYCAELQDANMIQLRGLDLNGDGYVNNLDALMLAKYLVGKAEI